MESASSKSGGTPAGFLLCAGVDVCGGAELLKQPRTGAGRA